MIATLHLARGSIHVGPHAPRGGGLRRHVPALHVEELARSGQITDALSAL